MDHILNKLSQKENSFSNWKDWSMEEKKQLLELYLIISKKEEHIFDLIYQFHGCDSWEDIFRDYKSSYLQDKANGVQVAIDGITEYMKPDSDDEDL